ncbi:FAD-binding oxidoreductase [Amycolatopsis sp. FDAARGOS 1241]|uniref:FAD-binding oxidoreductase n=1 Tax=Amycolatopsis sp. FDAARGOS 1241 TaxID=2778070 RepID=UPI00195046EC|nr:FAD-binding oxidoreductase [Amycolatopsis sp. FDAARGOS 1241]QRP49964.1 FAD-binding oxidoreductase [Amycolatopsis sp. FDAARGOS 1241]
MKQSVASPATGLIQAEDITDLVAVTDGDVLLPGEPGYAAECAGFNVNNPLEPALVVAAAGTADVQHAVRFARRRSLPVAIKATAHQVVQPAHGAVLITTSRMTGVTVDPGRRVARVEAGARWAQVIAEAARHGLAPLVGSAPGVGVVGYTLGGGLSPTLGRSRGYAADHVRLIEVVTADGVQRHATAETERDLFWALRGGKGNFGVVTALEFDLFPVTRFYGGGLYYAGQHLAAVLHAWREWVQQLPEDATSSVMVQRLPPAPELPEVLRGAFVVHLRFAHLGSPADAEGLLAPLRAAAPVLLDLMADKPLTAIGDIHLDPADPLPYYDRTTSLREVTAETIETLVELTGPDSDCPLLGVELRALGGALDREPAAPNAVPVRGVPFVVFALGVGGPDRAGELRGALDTVVGALAPWASARQAPNFLSADEGTSAAAVRAIYGPERYDRLAAVKKVYDPGNLFRVNHNIRPAA